MSDQHQRPGPSNSSDAEKPAASMTLAEYLSLPENKNANLVMPKSWCEHLETINKEFKEEDLTVKRPCENCENVGENWICLVCYKVMCSRYVNEHMLFHSVETEHKVTLSFSDISVWCYGCEDYVDNELLYPMKNALHIDKFKEPMPRPNYATMTLDMENTI